MSTPNMTKKFALTLRLVIGSIAILHPDTQAQIWTGSTSDLTLGGPTGNWNSQATPDNTETAEFQTTGVLNTLVSTTTTSSTFNPLDIQFDNGASTYTLLCDGNNVSSGSANIIIGDGTSGAVINNSSNLQNIQAIQGGAISFLSGSSACPSSNSEPIQYFVGSNSTNAISTMTFTDAFAGTSTIQLNDNTFLLPATLDFNGTSSAEQSTISVNESSVITFSDSSDVSQAEVDVNSNSSAIFNTNTTATSGFVNLTTNASATLSKDITLKRLTADSSTTINLNGNKLIITDPISDTINGAIIGSGGILEKQGTNSLTLANTSNSYTGNTIIADGDLYVTPATLSSNIATIQPDGTLGFSSGTGIYNGTITNDGNIEISSLLPITLSGAISGSGTLSVFEDLTLTSTNNTYTGQTFVSGTLHTKASTLPPNASIIGQGSGTIEFTNNIQEIFSGIISGTAQVIMDGTGSLIFSGKNTYTGGTVVNSGTLIASTSTIPLSGIEPSITINGSSIFNFFQSAPGTFYGDVVIANVSANLQTDGLSPLTLVGNISGPGTLNVHSGYTILNSTSNTYTGGTTVSGGTLQTTVETLPTLIKKINSLNGTLVFRETTDETYSARILAGTGTLQKEGAATLTLTGDNSGFQGTTKILQGRLAVLSPLGGNVLVDTGGILSGTGPILGSLHVKRGTIAPGSSIGSMNINGNYTQDINGIYAVEIDGIGNSDLINISGSASLSGTLAVYSIDGVVDVTQTYTILHADGGISGEYAQVTSNIPSIIPTVTYGRDDVFLNLQHILVTAAATHNQRAVSGQLMRISNPTTEESAIIDKLNTLSSNPNTLNSARRALDQMSGEQYTNTFLLTEISSRQFLRRLYDPLRPLLTADPSQRSVQFCTPYQDGSFDFPIQEPYCCSDAIDSGTFWAAVGGGRTFIRHDTNANGLSADSFDVSVGLQNTITQSFTIGIAAGYQHDTINYNIGGSGKSNIGMIGVYTLYNPRSFYLLGDLVFEYSSCQVKRTVDIDDLHYKARGKPVSSQGTFYAEFGKRIAIESFQVIPFVGIEGDWIVCKEFKEHGADPINLSVWSHTRGAAFSRLGVHLVAGNPCSPFSFDIDLAWQCRLTSLTNHVNENFLNFGKKFTIYGVTLPRNCLEGTANVGLQISDNCSAYLEFTGQRWERLSSYNFTAGLLVNW